MNELLALFRSADGLAGRAAAPLLSALGPRLTIGGSSSDERASPALATSAGGGAEARWLAKEGVAQLLDAAPADTCTRLAESIERLTNAGLPAMFVYLFDEPWTLGERLRARVSAMVGVRYELVEDVWAWRIAPGSRGWPPHRGLAEPILARDAPQLINTWVALSDVEADRACMHFIPLDDDVSYPEALTTLDGPLSAVRASPLQAGSALAWNANILHWGGPCSARANGPRVSCSFSLARADSLAMLGLPLAERATLDLRERLDAIARQVQTYGKGQLDVSAAVLEWAAGVAALKATIESFSETLRARSTVT